MLACSNTLDFSISLAGTFGSLAGLDGAANGPGLSGDAAPRRRHRRAHLETNELYKDEREDTDQSPAYHGCAALAGDSPWSGFTSSPSESSSNGFRDEAAPTLSSSGPGGLYLSR